MRNRLVGVSTGGGDFHDFHESIVIRENFMRNIYQLKAQIVFQMCQMIMHGGSILLSSSIFLLLHHRLQRYILYWLCMYAIIVID